MKYWKSMLGLLVALFVVSSCSKDDQSESASYTVALKASSTKSVGSWSINSATAILTELELESDDDDDGNDDNEEDEIDLEGRYEINLLTGTSVPALPRMEIGNGNYEELEITLGDDDGDEVALLVEAVWQLDTVTRVVSIEVEGELEYELESDNGIVFTNDMSRELTVYIGIQNALEAMDISQVQVVSGTTVLINPQSNPQLYSEFVNALNFELDD